MRQERVVNSAVLPCHCYKNRLGLVLSHKIKRKSENFNALRSRSLFYKQRQNPGMRRAREEEVCVCVCVCVFGRFDRAGFFVFGERREQLSCPLNKHGPRQASQPSLLVFNSWRFEGEIKICMLEFDLYLLLF
jgi:hypothetical protein